MLDNVPKNVKIVAVCILLIIVVAIGYRGYVYVDHANKIAVAVTVVPEDGTVTFNGKNEGKGTVYLKEGKYDIKASKPGYEDTSYTQYIDKDRKVITLGLRASSKEAKQWVSDNQEKYLELEGEAGKAANDQGVAFQEINPIVLLLPYQNLLYTIGYRADPSDPTGNSIILEIDATTGYRNAAIQQIRNLGYDPTNFKIHFKNYENPFAL